MKKNKAVKILWFTNTPSLSEELLDTKKSSGGWIKSLEKELTNNNKIKLGVCFYYNKNIPPFKINNTQYYPIYDKTKTIKFKLVKIFKHKDELNFQPQRLLKIIDEFNPNLIHVHGTEKSFGLIAKHTKIPVIISIQGILNVIQKKYFSSITKFDILCFEKLKFKVTFNSIIDHYKTLKYKARREEEILQNIKYIIGRTNWDKRVSRVLAPKSKYFHVDEILRDRFYNQKWKNNTSNTFFIYTTINSTIFKGFYSIIETIKLLNTYNNFHYVWTVAGIKPKDNIVNISLKKAGLKKIPTQLKLIGQQNEQAITNYLSNSNLYISTSHIDNSPNSLCEAMMLGLPCIATHAGGTNTLLTNDKDGILIQDGDPWAMAGAIKEIINNPERAVNYGKSARIKALKRHDKSFIVDKLISVYKEIIN